MTISFATTVYASPLEDLPATRSLPSTAEKIAATYGAGIAGQIQFLPYLETPTRDTPEIRAAIRSMLKDPYVKAAWLTQCFSVASSDFQVHPYDEDDEDAVQQADFIQDCVDRLHLGFAGLAFNVLVPLGPDGISIVEPVTEVADKGRWSGRWMPCTVKSKDLENLYILGDRYRNIESIRSLRTPELGMVPASEFLITRYAPVFDEVFGWAAFRSSYQAWWMLDTVRKLRAIHHEKRTGGTVVGEYEDPSQRPTLEDTLRKLKSSTWAAVPKGVTLTLLDLTKASDTDYAKFEEDKIRDIVVGITFAELQMLTSPNERGDTKVHQNQSKLPIWYLTKLLEETINSQWIPRYIDWNFADPQGYPRLTVGGPDEEEVGRLVDLIQKAQQVGFNDLDKDYYAKALGLQRTQDPMKMLQPGGGQNPMGQPGMIPGDDHPNVQQDDYSTDDLGLGGDDGDDFGGDDAQLFAETDWTAFKGKRGGNGWRNTKTGEVKYQQENPGGSEQAGQGEQKPESPSDKPAQQPETSGQQQSQPSADASGHAPDTGSPGEPSQGKPGVFGKVRSYANKALDTKVGRLAQAAEHKLSIAAHKTRAIAVRAAEVRGATPEESQRLAKTLAIADFVGAYVSGAAAGAVAGPVGAKVAMFMPSVSAAYLAYSAARDPRATWKAALDVVASSSIDPRHLLREGKAAWSGGAHHAEGGTPSWVDQLAAATVGIDPEQAEFRSAVFLAALVATGDPEQALQLATNPPQPKPAAATRKFAEGANFTGTIKDSLGRERHYVDGKQVAGHHDEPAAQHAGQQPAGGKQHQQDPEHAEHRKRWDAENAQIENRRAAHDAANDAKAEATRKEREATRAKEDAEVSEREAVLKKRREELPAKRKAEDKALKERRKAEDKNRKATRETEDRERTKTRKARDKALEKERDKKDAADLKRWDKEDKEREKAREKQDADIEAKRDREDEEAGGEISDEVQQHRDDEDEKLASDRDDEDERIDNERSELSDADNDAREQEDADNEEKDEAEDSEIEEKRDQEDADIEEAREREDGDIETARQDEDDTLDAEEADIENTREDYENTRPEEDDALDSEETEAYESERRRRDDEDAQHYHDRRKQHPGAHAAYYDGQHHYYQSRGSA